MPSFPDAVVLCGGAGVRLRSVVGEAPKGMANVAGRPFLELLLRQLSRHGFERVILAVSYQRHVIQSHFGERAFGLQLVYSTENVPLGTGGALRNAADLIASENVLVMNGDSYTGVELSAVLADHNQADADASMVVVPTDGRVDCGSVMIDNNHNLVGFAEKQDPFHAAHINAGIYILSRQMLHELPGGVQLSLEKELLPQWLREGKRINAFLFSGRCIDIGTPERYQYAQGILANVEAQAIGARPEGEA